jgi:hypothetical protein
MSEDKIKITFNEAIGLINYLNNLPSKERGPYETLQKDLHQLGINKYTASYVTEQTHVELDKKLVMLFRLKYGL